jgi:hypothetical protein
MSIRDKPHFTLPAATLADWIESQPEKWWSVDGDPTLSSILDFPCPGDEIAPAIRADGKNLLVQAKDGHSPAHGEVIAREAIDALSEYSKKRRHKILRLTWADSDVDWLLLEDEAMVAT